MDSGAAERSQELAQPQLVRTATDVERASQADHYSVQDPRFRWNEQLQSIVSLPCMTPEESRVRREAIGRLGRRFAREIRPVCEQIVAEMGLPDSEKTIKPANVGGIAGGVKFIHNGVLLKFASDDAGIYGNSKEGAGKAAKLEFRAL